MLRVIGSRDLGQETRTFDYLEKALETQMGVKANTGKPLINNTKKSKTII